jgi:alkylation response protein AidB-like acyl-CoA dehydrogenase
MNFDDTPQEAAFRAEARAWLDANAPHELRQELEDAPFGRLQLKSVDATEASRAWQKKKSDAGWAVLHWPQEYGGRGATPIERVIWQQEEGVYGKLSALFGIGHGMCGPTMMAWAAEEQKRERLPKLAAGVENWCQLFSEPSGGSDVAGLRTRAERDGDDWVVNGQKIWTSVAHLADWGLLILRTDPNVPKHDGLTMFFLNMKSPGVEIRPIKQANGQSDFNEVFFTDVRIPDSQRLGPVGGGWKVSITTLMNERASIGARAFTGFPELFEFVSGVDTPDGPALDNPAVRSKLANWAARSSGLKYTAYRAITELSKGQLPGPENSIGKLVSGSMLQEIAMYALDLQGEAGILLDPAQAEAAARFQGILMRSPAVRIEGGTDEILRNIIAERVLGLPPDIRADKGIPFNKIPTKAG